MNSRREPSARADSIPKQGIFCAQRGHSSPSPTTVSIEFWFCKEDLVLFTFISPLSAFFPMISLRTCLFQSPNHCTEDLHSGIIWVFRCHQCSLHGRPFCVVEHIYYSFSVCALSHLGLWGGLVILQGKFLLTAATVQFCFLQGLSLRRSPSPHRQAEGARLESRGK